MLSFELLAFMLTAYLATLQEPQVIFNIVILTSEWGEGEKCSLRRKDLEGCFIHGVGGDKHINT